jgi:hypothetical protein
MATQFIETTTGNRVSRKAILCGSQNVRINGKVRAMLLRLCTCRVAPRRVELHQTDLR